MKFPNKMFPVFIVLVIFGTLILVADNFGLLKPIKSLTGAVITPIEGMLYKQKIGSTVLTGRTSELESENRKLISTLAELETCKKENSDMKSLLGAPLPASWKFVPAMVVGWDNGSLLVDKGSDDRIKPGMTVIYENTFIGRTANVNNHTSRVDTLFSQKLKIPVIVKRFVSENSTATVGKIGQGLLISDSDSMTLDKVLIGEGIAVGDVVLTSGDIGIPVDLPVGKITKVEKKESAIFQKANVEPLLTYKNLSTVFVIISE